MVGRAGTFPLSGSLADDLRPEEFRRVSPTADAASILGNLFPKTAFKCSRRAVRPRMSYDADAGENSYGTRLRGCAAW